MLGLAIVYCAQVFRVVIEVFNYYGQNMLMDGESLYPVFLRKTLFQIERAMARLTVCDPVNDMGGVIFLFSVVQSILQESQQLKTDTAQ